MPKRQSSLLPTEVENNALEEYTTTRLSVCRTKLKPTSPIVNTGPNQNCSQLVCQVESTDSQQLFTEQNSSMQAFLDTQEKTRPSQSSKNLLQMQDSVRVRNCNYCTLRRRDQRLKCTFISIFYGAMLYLPNFQKIQHTWANIRSTLGKKNLIFTLFHHYLTYPAIKQ